MKSQLKITGMTCQMCARHVREAIESVPGVGAARVDLVTESATYEGYAPLEEIQTAVAKAGYTALEA